MLIEAGFVKFICVSNDRQFATELQGLLTYFSVIKISFRSALQGYW